MLSLSTSAVQTLHLLIISSSPHLCISFRDADMTSPEAAPGMHHVPIDATASAHSLEGHIGRGAEAYRMSCMMSRARPSVTDPRRPSSPSASAALPSVLASSVPQEDLSLAQDAQAHQQPCHLPRFGTFSPRSASRSPPSTSCSIWLRLLSQCPEAAFHRTETEYSMTVNTRRGKDISSTSPSSPALTLHGNQTHIQCSSVIARDLGRTAQRAFCAFAHRQHSWSPQIDIHGRIWSVAA